MWRPGRLQTQGASGGRGELGRAAVADDEQPFRLGQHRFAVGEYVTVTDEDGRPLTYKVVEVQPA